MKVLAFNIFSIILYFIAVAWNFQSGGLYNLELAIGALVLGVISAWEKFLI